jgi:hypothetical protein
VLYLLYPHDKQLAKYENQAEEFETKLADTVSTLTTQLHTGLQTAVDNAQVLEQSLAQEKQTNAELKLQLQQALAIINNNSDSVKATSNTTSNSNSDDEKTNGSNKSTKHAKSDTSSSSSSSAYNKTSVIDWI